MKNIALKLKTYLKIFAFLVLSAVAISGAHALTVVDDEVALKKSDVEAGKLLNKVLADLKNMRSDFYQRVTTAEGDLLEEASGTFYLSKPGRFRWDYIPEEGAELGNVITSNGEKLSLYDADLETLSERQLDDVFDQVPSLVLVSENIDVSKLFHVNRLSKRDGVEWFELLPLSNEVTYDFLQIALKGNGLAGMNVKDLSGQLISVSFDQLETNIELTPQLFDFKAPEGTDILSQ